VVAPPGDTSESTQKLVDEEVRRLIESAHREVTDLLIAHSEQLDSLGAALLKAETLNEINAYAAAQMPIRR
jgi:cell division protease FtsH